MRSLVPLTLYCISLVSLQELTSALGESPDGSRSDLLDVLFYWREAYAPDSGSQFETRFPGRLSAWRAVRGWPRPTQSQPSPALQGNQTAQGVSRHVGRTLPSLAWARPADEAPWIRRGSPRARRHAPPGPRGGHHYAHNAQLMRVGCILGTCQVQNLSHRLYQLIGQSGREDSSPINPRSPHSYG